jgi:integrase
MAEIPAGGDVATFLMTEGKKVGKTVIKDSRLRDLIEQFFDALPEGNLEENSVKTMKTHCKHIKRLLRPGTYTSAISKDEMNHYFEKAIRGTKYCQLVGWHGLRHSFCSNCASQGIDQRIIDAWVGHTTDEMRRRYRHLFPSTENAAMETVFGFNGTGEGEAPGQNSADNRVKLG